MIIDLRIILAAGLGNDESKDIIEMVKRAGATHLEDIRRQPRSKRFESHDSKAVENLCRVFNVEYHWRPDLAPPSKLRKKYARLGKSKRVWEEYNRDFEQYLRTIEGRRGLASLRRLIEAGAVICLLCAEKDFSMCHRSIVAEHLSRMTESKVIYLTINRNPIVFLPRITTEQSVLFGG